jgi:hypothetical protein
MSIISPLPYTIVNGSVIDADPVMADFNQIVNNVNSNAAAINGSSTQVFNVATATTADEAVSYGQAQSQFAATHGSPLFQFDVANATAAQSALPLGQAQADFAAINGSSTQVFNVAYAATSDAAVPLHQAQTSFASIQGSPSFEFDVAPAATGTQAIPLAQAQANFPAINGSATQVFNVATATTGTEAIPLAQAQANFPAINGSATQVFNVAPASLGTQAVPLGQVANVPPSVINYAGGTGTHVTYAAPTISFTVPSNGYVLIYVDFHIAAVAAFGNITFQIIVNGVVVTYDTPGPAASWSMNAAVAGTAGATMTVVAQYVVGSSTLSNPIYLHGFVMYVPTP